MRARGKTYLNNSFNEGGSIKWKVLSGVHKEYKCDIINSELVITDCSNTIVLDFDCEKKAHIPKRIAKLDVLIDELSKMKAALVQAENETKKKKFYY